MDSVISTRFKNEVWPLYESSLKRTRTKYDYFSNLTEFCNFVNKDVCDIEVCDAEAYVDFLCSKFPDSLTFKTCETRLSSLRSIFNFLVKNEFFILDRTGYVLNFKSNPFNNLYLQRPDNYTDLKNIPTIKELDSLLSIAKDSPLDMLVISLVAKMGLSIGEVVKICFNDFSYVNDTNVLRVLSVGGAVRNVLVPDDIVKLLAEYVNYVKAKNIPVGGGYLFISPRKRVYTTRSLERHLQGYVSSLLAAGLISKPFTFQDLRSLSFVLMFAGGATDEAVADYVGVTETWLFRHRGAIDTVISDAVELSIISIGL